MDQNGLTELYQQWFREFGADAATEKFEDYLRTLIQESEPLRQMAYEAFAKDLVILIQEKCLDPYPVPQHRTIH